MKYGCSLSTDYDFSGGVTVAYLSSGASSSGHSKGSSPSPDADASDSFDSSDEEPLIKYKLTQKDSEGPERSEPPEGQGLPPYEDFVKHKRGRPKECAQAPTVISADPHPLLNEMLKGIT